MRREARTVILVGAAAAILAGGSGIAAWAGWSLGSGPAASAAVTAARIPVMAAPHAAISAGKPKLTWAELPASSQVDHYVVIRSAGANQEVACSVSTAVTSCLDDGATAGSTVRYLIHATLGPRWAGRDSAPSDPVEVPADTTLVRADTGTAPVIEADEGTATGTAAKSGPPSAAEPAQDPAPAQTPASIEPSPSESTSEPATDALVPQEPDTTPTATDSSAQ